MHVGLEQGNDKGSEGQKLARYRIVPFWHATLPFSAEFHFHLVDDNDLRDILVIV